MGGKGFEGLRASSLKAAAKEQARATEQRRERREALREVIEGSGGNYIKAVIYQEDGEDRAALHVLLYLFEPSEVGERVANGWLFEVSRHYGAALRASVYAACTGPLAGLPVIGAPMREKAARQVRRVEAGTYESERAAMGRAVEAA
jgi:hypothetical protein